MTNTTESPRWRWKWLVSCDLCGWHSLPFDSREIAKGLAFLHSVVHHPYGATRIAAVDEHTHFTNETARRLEGNEHE